MEHINDILALFKVGMKCIGKEDLKRFYKSGGDLMRAITSIKLDGARLHAFTSNLDVAHKSYNLKDFENFGCLTPWLRSLKNTQTMRDLKRSAIMFDGEVLDRNAKTRNAKFKGVMQQLHRIHGLDDSGFRFHAFDFWYPGIDIPQETRLYILKLACEELGGADDRIVFHKHVSHAFENEEQLMAYVKAVLGTGAEGIVLKNPEGLYEMRRSPHWVKLIAEETLDLYVEDIIEGEGKLIGHIGKFVCKLENGQTVKVGPGSATHEELREWYVDANKRPRMIEVKFKEYTEKGSLRHPRYYRRRDDKA